MGLIAVLLGAGCAASAPQVKPTMREVPPRSAIVVGKFGALSRGGEGLFYELQALQVETKKTWKLPLSAGDGDGNSNSVPFFLELPPGLYLLTKWMYMTNSQEYSGDNAGVLFDLAPGQITCIGAVYMGSRGIIANTHGSSTHFRGGTRAARRMRRPGGTAEDEGAAVARSGQEAGPRRDRAASRALDGSVLRLREDLVHQVRTELAASNGSVRRLVHPEHPPLGEGVRVHRRGRDAERARRNGPAADGIQGGVIEHSRGLGSEGHGHLLGLGLAPN
jgi:hypothetical protein